MRGWVVGILPTAIAVWLFYFVVEAARHDNIWPF